MIKVKVPATSANLGVGFDCLGVALSKYTIFSFEESATLEIEGCEERFCNEDNLVYTSFLKALAFLKKDAMNVHIVIDSDVPVSRGLGSSATCVVGGIMGAYYLTHTPINKADILNIATQIEGHPDNVAPAIYGNLCISSVLNNEVVNEIIEVSPKLNFEVLIPDFETLTEDMRNVLPKSVPFSDATHNASCLGLAIRGFQNGDLSLLSKVLDDRLHEPYRKSLINEFEEVKTICNSIDSVAFLISGSGSTLMNIIRDKNNESLIKDELKKLKHSWRSYVLDIDPLGARAC